MKKKIQTRLLAEEEAQEVNGGAGLAEQFSGLPMEELIGGPLLAACDAQVQLARATADFINAVGFERNDGQRADGKK